MAFVSEREVSEDDIVKFKLREISKEPDAKFFMWTIDRERDVYIRPTGYDWQEPTRQYYSCYWKGRVIDLDVLFVSDEGNPGDVLRQTWRVMSLDGSGRVWLPADLEPLRGEITSDLKDAFAARIEHDYGNRHTSYEFTLHF